LEQSVDLSRMMASATPPKGLRKSRWPAKLDLFQSLTGLLLVLFIWGHMFFEGSILLGNDAMYRMTKFFEGRYFFGTDYPIIVTFAAVAIMAIFVVHAALALRKFPKNHGEYRTIRSHIVSFDHDDTSMWWVQVWTGFLMFFLGSVHLINMMVQPGNIGPFESADRIWSGWMWPVYALLLVTVHLHAGLGIYRLAVKWGFFEGEDVNKSRATLKVVRWAIIIFFLVLGFSSLGTYMMIGKNHSARVGERYVPAWEKSETPAAPQSTPGAAK
jgi:fumarate reductase subunit C